MTLTKKLSILMLSPDPRVTGGVTTFANTVVQNLENCSVSHLYNGSLDGIPQSPLSPLVRLITTPVRLFRMVRRNHYDVVHINPSLTYKSVIRDSMLLLALRLAGFKRTLFYIHGWQHEVAQSIQDNSITRRLFAWLLNGTGMVMVLSPAFRDGLLKMGVQADKVIATKTMFDGNLLISHPLPEGYKPPRKYILFMSRFVASKGVYELLDAFNDISQTYDDVDLVLAGTGEEMDGLKERVAHLRLAERVIFTGYVGGPEKAKWLQSCYIYALPTYMSGEGMPIALLEAMAAGKPLLSGTAGGINYILSDPRNGILLEKVTRESVKAGLEKLLGNPAYCDECAIENYAYAWKQFEAKHVVRNEIEARYHTIAALQ